MANFMQSSPLEQLYQLQQAKVVQPESEHPRITAFDQHRAANLAQAPEQVEFVDERTPPAWWKEIPGVEGEGDWALYSQHPTSYLTDQQIHDLNRPLPDRGIHIPPPPLDETISAFEAEQNIYDKQYTQAEMNKAAENLAALDDWRNEFLNALTGLMSSAPPLDEVMNTGGLGISAIEKPKDEGRRKPVKMENLRGEKPGYSVAEGSNFWSVDEKDPYWQTKEGFKEAMDLYGTKPGWVKEPTLTYNPKTGEYEEIEKEEFVDLKPTKRISL